MYVCKYKCAWQCSSLMCVRVKAIGQSWLSLRICPPHLRDDLSLTWNSSTRPAELESKSLGISYCHPWALELTNACHHTWPFCMDSGDQIHASSERLSIPQPSSLKLFPWAHIIVDTKDLFENYPNYIIHSVYSYINTKLTKENYTRFCHLKCWTGRVYSYWFFLVVVVVYRQRLTLPPRLVLNLQYSSFHPP